MKTLCLQNFCHSGPCGWHIHEIKAHNRQYPTLHMPFRVLFVKQTGTQEVLFPCPPFQFTKVPCVTHEWNILLHITKNMNYKDFEFSGDNHEHVQF